MAPDRGFNIKMNHKMNVVVILSVCKVFRGIKKVDNNVKCYQPFELEYNS